ncbi:hypothetical protein Q5H92_09285 [Hymenobacter sp. M29]|uniref:RiboL-PSP-HEPN domain-containing protein n=1 Tax=Hymenobacter mellowenesis TaxID=3063995 RepID=A0ABT9ACV5_9BACT|nr:hypothetical protein [Hymenobacter sp. M29]MDO7846547.1 hypothetical protein [Hymenobacter sp. M29]
MPFNAPDLETYKADLDNNIAAIQKLKTDSHATIKIQSLLNITAYVLATRFIEGAIKHIIYNCCKMRGDTDTQLTALSSELKKFNNPEFTLIRDEMIAKINFDILQGKTAGLFSDSDVSFLNEIVKNRHRNVHATFDPADWYNKNLKDLSDFHKEYAGVVKIVSYLDTIHYNHSTSAFSH